jgi:hypothetical protein
MNLTREVKIFIAIIVVVFILSWVWSATQTSRGKYKAPYKYYKGDNADYYRSSK